MVKENAYAWALEQIGLMPPQKERVDYSAMSVVNGKIKAHTQIKNVIFNPPATIVYWANGEKTVVKANKGETFDPEKGLAMAISKRVLGNMGNYYNEFKKWLPKNDKEEVDRK